MKPQSSHFLKAEIELLFGRINLPWIVNSLWLISKVLKMLVLIISSTVLFDFIEEWTFWGPSSAIPEVLSYKVNLIWGWGGESILAKEAYLQRPGDSVLEILFYTQLHPWWSWCSLEEQRPEAWKHLSPDFLASRIPFLTDFNSERCCVRSEIQKRRRSHHSLAVTVHRA